MLNAEFVFRRLRAERIDDPYAKARVVIIVDRNSVVEAAARGCRDDYEMFQLVHHVATGLAADITKTLKPRAALA
jgi:hypothetical protein